MKHIAFFLPNLHGGGAERVAINLLQGMSEKDLILDLVLASAEGPYLNQVPYRVRLIDLAAGKSHKFSRTVVALLAAKSTRCLIFAFESCKCYCSAS